MEILGFVWLITMIGLLGMYVYDDPEPQWFLSLICALAAGFVFICLLVLKPLMEFTVSASIERHKSIQQTVIDSRGHDGAEGTAFRLKIANQNAWLASMKYFNSSAVGWWIPDEIESLEPIK